MTLNAAQSLLEAAQSDHRAGRLDSAIAGYRRFLKIYPRHSKVESLLGIALTQSGNLEKGVRHLKAALKAAPRDPGIAFNLGNAELAADHRQGALVAFEKTVKLAPNHAEAWFNKGMLLEQMGRSEDALTAYRKARGIKPTWSAPRFGVVRLLVRTGRAADAVSDAEALVRALPNTPSALNARAVVHRACERFAEAEADLNAAAAIDSKNLETRQNRALLLLDTRRHDEAERLLEEILSDQPDQPAALLALARVYAATRRQMESLKLFQRCPDQPEVLYHHAFTLERLNRPEEAQAMLEGAVANGLFHPGFAVVAARLDRRKGLMEQGLDRLDSLSLDSIPERSLQAMIRFDQAILLDRLGNTDLAWTRFEEGNRLSWAEDPRISASAVAERLDHLKYFAEGADGALFSQAWRKARRTGPPASESPVFLVGFPRSGTTLLGAILDAHPALATLDERLLLDTVNLTMVSDGWTPERLADLPDAEAERYRRQYWTLAMACPEYRPGRQLVDKGPLGFTELPVILSLFPNAQFIFLIRHPADACLSCFMQHFDRSPTLAWFVSAQSAAQLYDRVMQLWETYRALLPELPVLDIRYEALTDQFEDETRRLLNGLGLAWDEAVLGYARRSSERNVVTPSYAQVSEPVYRRAAGRWTRYRSQLEPALDILKPWMERLGYSTG